MSAPLADLERRIALLEDIEAIKQLKYRYLRACDHKDADVLRECFLAGPVTIDYGRVGQFARREELMAVFERLACHDHILELHHGHNPSITVAGDVAQGIWSLYYFQLDTQGRSATQLGGQYNDEYHRTADGWRIASSCFALHSSQVLDYSEAAARITFAGREMAADGDAA